MFFHRKQLMLDVKCQDANPLFGQMLLEQFGGATGELTAALTYWTQSFHVEDPAIRDMLQDIAIEEFSHLEMVGRMIEQHTEKSDARDAAYRSTLFAVRGIGPHLVDSKGQAWTAAYVSYHRRRLSHAGASVRRHVSRHFHGLAAGFELVELPQ